MIFRAVAQEIKGGNSPATPGFLFLSLFFFVWLELAFCGISSFCLGTKHEPPSAPVHLRPQSREPTTRPCSHTTTFARSDSGWDIIQSSRSSVFFFLFLPQRRRWDVESARQGPHAVFGPQAQLPSCKTITSTSCRSRSTYIVLTKPVRVLPWPPEMRGAAAPSQQARRLYQLPRIDAG